MAKISFEIVPKVLVKRKVGMSERSYYVSKPLVVDYKLLEKQRKSIQAIVDNVNVGTGIGVSKQQLSHLHGIENMLNDICDFFHEKTKKHKS